MAKIAQNQCTKPSAWIVSSNDKGRKSIKNGKVFLKDGSEFEIELFNPLQKCVLAEIKLNGQPISKTGLIIKPGQRFYLDCFIDDKRKFIFNTYEIENSEESLNATQKNGLLEVFFYKEDVITIDNWRNKFQKIIIEKYYPVYPSVYPYVYPSPWLYSGSITLVNSSLSGTLNNTYCTTTNVTNLSNNNCTYTSGINITNSSNFSNSLETGRIEKGSKSSQEFTEIDMEFESNYISSTILQILPDSRKPVEVKDIKNSKNEEPSNNVIELIKKLSDLHLSGILTEEEFNTKKSELLSKI